MDKIDLSTLVPLWLDYVRREELNAVRVPLASPSLLLLPESAVIGDRLLFTEQQVTELHRGPLREYLASIRDPHGSKPYPDDIYLAFGLCLEREKNGESVVPLCLIPLGRNLVGLIARTENSIDLAKVTPKSQFVVAALTRNIGYEDMELDSLEMGGGVFEFCESMTGSRPATSAAAAAAIRSMLEERQVRSQTGFAVMKLSLSDYSRKLQEDLLELAALEPADSHSPLASLLSGKRSESLKRVGYDWVGQFSAFTMNDGQAAILASLASGERLALCDGPPGTGKTELALNAIANQISRLALRLAEGGELSGTRLPALVASDTNKAVENIIDSIEGRFPGVPFIWLKTGSSQRNREAGQRISGMISTLQAQAYNSDAHQAARSALLDAASRLAAARDGFDTRQRAVFTGEVALVEIERELALSQEALDQYNVGQQTRGPLPPLAHIEECLATVTALNGSWSAWDRAQLLIGSGPIPALRRSLTQFSDVFALCGISVPTTGSDAEMAVARLLDSRRAREAEDQKAMELSARIGALRKRKSETERTLAATRRRLCGITGNHHQQSEESAALMRSIFELSVVVLWHEALNRKSEVIEALDLYRTALEVHNSTAQSRIAEVRRDFTALVSLAFPLIACSMNSLRAGWPLPIVESIDLAIADEAVMTHCHKGFPLAARCHSLLVLGDPRQLPAIVSLSKSQMADFTNAWGLGEGSRTERFNPARRTLYALVSDTSKPVTLTEHRRATREIADTFCKIGQYPELRIFEPILTEERATLRKLLAPHKPLVWLDCDGSAPGNSNEAELAVIKGLIDKLRGQGTDIRSALCCITPFRAQERLLTSELCFKTRDLFPRQVGTVHKFQGQEYPLVVFSVVADDPEGGAAWFLRQRRDLVNVAISRAQEGLVVVGSISCALRAGGAVGDLANHILDHGCVLPQQSASGSPTDGVAFSGDECLALAPYLAARCRHRLILAVKQAFEIEVIQEFRRLCDAMSIGFVACLPHLPIGCEPRFDHVIADTSQLSETTFICDTTHVISGDHKTAIVMPNSHGFSAQDFARMKIEELRQRMPAVVHPLDPSPAGLRATYSPEEAKSLCRMLGISAPATS